MKNLIISFLYILLFFNISYTFSQTKNSNIESTTKYFHQRNEAASLVKNKKWQESIAILKNLTKDYENDPDLFYLLGLSYYQIEQYQDAITVLKKTLNLGGTILREIPTGSAPSNDIMIKISTNKKDFDFSVILYELAPEGNYFHLSYYIGRASYSKNREKRELITLNKITNVTFDNTKIISKKIAKGSKIVIVINGNKNPYGQINYGTGKDVSSESITDANTPLELRFNKDSKIVIPLWKDK